MLYVPSGRCKQVGSAQDEQGGGEVADLEQREGTQQPAKLAVQDRADPDPLRAAFPRGGQPSVADGVDDRQGGEQARDDRDQDRGVHGEHRDQAEREHPRSARAPRVPVTRLTISAVGTSCPTSARKLAAPIPRVIHCRSEVSAGSRSWSSRCSVTRRLSRPAPPGTRSLAGRRRRVTMGERRLDRGWRTGCGRWLRWPERHGAGGRRPR